MKPKAPGLQFTENYKEIQSLIGFNARSAVRKIVLDLNGIKESLLGEESYLVRPRVQFLYLHHTFKDELESFKALLTFLQRHHTFVSYSSAVELAITGNVDKPYIAFSFDDGFKNNLDAGHVLNDFGTSACFFINPGLIGEVDESIIQTHCKSKLEFPPVAFLNWNDIENLQKQGNEIGSHTMFHDNVATLNRDDLAEDMSKTFQIINSKCGEAKHFAFPYGRFHQFNDLGRQMCFDAGFISCASAERGCHIANRMGTVNREFCVRRDHVMLSWPLHHIRHFLIRSSKTASEENNLFPYPVIA